MCSFHSSGSGVWYVGVSVWYGGVSVRHGGVSVYTPHTTLYATERLKELSVLNILGVVMPSPCFVFEVITKRDNKITLVYNGDHSESLYLPASSRHFSIMIRGCRECVHTDFKSNMSNDFSSCDYLSLLCIMFSKNMH